MRLMFFYIVLLALAFCSCRSSSHTVADYTASAQVDSAKTVVSESHVDIISAIVAASQLDLEDIAVEFYPPDSIKPYIRAAPRSLTIKTAKASLSLNAVTHHTNDSNSVETAASKSSAEESLAYNTRSEKSVMRPADWFLMIGFTGVLAVLLLFMRNFRRRL